MEEFKEKERRQDMVDVVPISQRESKGSFKKKTEKKLVRDDAKITS
jgi:hypothetical protein